MVSQHIISAYYFTTNPAKKNQQKNPEVPSALVVEKKKLRTGKKIGTKSQIMGYCL